MKIFRYVVSRKRKDVLRRKFISEWLYDYVCV